MALNDTLPALKVINKDQWQSVPFKDHFLFYEHGLISITAYWGTVIHISFTQLNVTSIGLGYHMIL
jgi:hypothetical protein